MLPLLAFIAIALHPSVATVVAMASTRAAVATRRPGELNFGRADVRHDARGYDAHEERERERTPRGPAAPAPGGAGGAGRWEAPGTGNGVSRGLTRLYHRHP